LVSKGLILVEINVLLGEQLDGHIMVTGYMHFEHTRVEHRPKAVKPLRVRVLSYEEIG